MDYMEKQDKTSAISGFYKKSIDERLEIVKEFSNLTSDDIDELKKTGSLDLDKADMMIENVIGTFQLPFGIATNFIINGKECLIPMVIEEPSVVAAASNVAKLARISGGFKTNSTEPIMIGQIQMLGIEDFDKAKQIIEQNRDKILEMSNNPDSSIVKLGGGLKNIEYRAIETAKGKMFIVHLVVDVKDAMGANTVNSIAEKVANYLEEITGGEARLRILSNLAEKRIAMAEAIWKKETLEKSVKNDISGEKIVDAIIDAYEFAANDQYRATTHNKGIMNGIDAVCIATGNDFRALESGAHSFAAFNRKYGSLTKYEKTTEGDLKGSIEIPIAVGVVGGSIKTNPIAKIGVKIIGAKTSRELAEVMAAVGLAQNFAAIRALATEGIQRGHMKLHAKNLALSAGAKNEEIDIIVKRLTEEKNFTASRAGKILEEIRGKE